MNEKNATTRAGDGREPIAVLLLKFSEPIDLPKKATASGVQTDRQVNRAGYELYYLPWMRHFLVQFHEIEGREGSKDVYVHESKVKCWEPMPAKKPSESAEKK